MLLFHVCPFWCKAVFLTSQPYPSKYFSLQEVLVVGIGRRVLKIDTTKVGKGEKFSSDEPLKCPIEKLIDGIQLVGSHDGEVTDLSMCQWMTTRLVSASVDGTVCPQFRNTLL